MKPRLAKTILMILFLTQMSYSLVALQEKPKELKSMLDTAELYLDWLYFDEAQKFYLEILQHYPMYVGINEALGYICLAQQRYDESIVYFNKELVLQPKNDLPRLLLGLAHFQGGDAELAQKIIEKVYIDHFFMKDNPKLEKYMDTNNYSYMKKYPFFKKFIKDNPGLIPFVRGILYQRQGHWEKAGKMMAEAAEQKYCLAEVMVQLVGMHLQQQDYASAAFELSKLQCEDSQLAEQLNDFVKAQDCQKTRRFALSRPIIIRYFKKPISAIVKELNVMAQESVKRADPQSAFKTWKKALFADETRFEIHYNLALIYCLYNFQKEALYHCRRAIDLGNPRYQSWALNLAGNIEFEMGHYIQALEYYQQAVSLDPNYLKCRNNLGATYMKLGDVEHAEQEWRKVIRNSGKGEKENDVQESGEQDKIKVLVDVKESDDIIEASKSLAVLYILQERQAKATILLENILQFSPTDADAHFMLGKIYVKLENPDLARQHLNAAIKNGTIHEAEARKLCLELDKMTRRALPKPK